MTRGERLALAGVLLCVVAACGHAVLNELVWDDIYIVKQGDVIFHAENLAEVFAQRTMFISSNNRSLPNSGAQTYRPITVATFFWDAWISGRDATSYHVTNLLAHLLTVLLVFAFVRTLLPDDRKRYALLAAAWFGLQPELAEAHVWIDGRSDLFCALSAVASVLVWRRHFASTSRARAAGVHFATFVLFLFALLSKEPAIGIVPVLLLWPEQRGRLVARLRSVAPFVAATLVCAGMRMHALDGVHASDGTNQLQTALLRAPTLLADGLAELLVPTRVYVRALSSDYDAWGTLTLTVIGIVVGVALVWVAMRGRRNPRLLFGVTWFVATLLPAAFVTTTLWPGFGRFLYLPAVGLALVVADLVSQLLERLALQSTRTLRLGLVAVFLYVAFLGIRLHLYVYDWKNEYTLYSSWIAGAPDRSHGYAWLGYTYLEHNDSAHAIPLLSEAARLSPCDPRFTASLVGIYSSVGRRDLAAQALAQCVARCPQNLWCSGAVRQSTQTPVP